MSRSRRFARLALPIVLALVAGAASAFAQGVGINSTGAPADTSAILDLAASNKGLLVPRMTAAQRAGIVLPATGLVVYQTDGTPGLWFNAGTPAAPNWQMVGANASTGTWSTSGSNLYYTAGKVAIGTTPGAFALSVMDPINGLRVQTNTPGSSLASFGGIGTFQVDSPGVNGGRLSILENGNLGLGVVNPTNKLSFPPVLGKKISLYPGTTGDVGFGVSGNRLQIYADHSGADVALGYDASGTFMERFAFKPNGAMAVMGNTGTTGQVLQSNGSGAAASWVSPTNMAFNNIYEVEGGTQMQVPINTFVDLPLSKTFTVPSAGGAAIISIAIPVSDPICTGCGGSLPQVYVYVDGGSPHAFMEDLSNGGYATITGTFATFLSSGTHTVTLRAFCSLKADKYLLGSGGANSLTIQVIPY